MEKRRSRRETRAAVLSYLWCSRGSFRPDLVAYVGLTDASVSRIVAELRADGLLDEARRTAPYQGGPSVFLTLSKDTTVAAFEISNNQIHVGVGYLDAEVLYSERYDLVDGTVAAGAQQAMTRAIDDLAQWSKRRMIDFEQISVSIPGYHPGRTDNPIVAIDAGFVATGLDRTFPHTPTTIVNSIVTRAVAHRFHRGVGHVGGTCFHVFVGHGVAAAVVDELAESGEVEPCEIGHMILDPRGPQCRCGHRGCLEAFVSTAAVAQAINVDETDILSRGERWAGEVRLSAKAQQELRERLVRLGNGIGNALNVVDVRKVIVTGWPSGLPADEWRHIAEGVDATLLGGAGDVDIAVTSAEMGREPASGLAMAAFAFMHRGGERRDRRRRRPAVRRAGNGITHSLKPGSPR